jgi:hypothetical protein
MDFYRCCGKSGGVLVLWNDNNFKVDSIEYGGQWIAIFGVHFSSDFACAVSILQVRV